MGKRSKGLKQLVQLIQIQRLAEEVIQTRIERRLALFGQNARRQGEYRQMRQIRVKSDGPSSA